MWLKSEGFHDKVKR
jgi:hypothetical protein